MTCPWCHNRIPATARKDSRFCSQKCRQAAWRLRHYLSGSTADASPGPIKLAYADPPYPGCAAKYYQHEASFAGEVDHRELINRLSSTYDGWALSTSAKALRDVLPLCPPEARVCAWVKPGGAPPETRGLHNVWEPVIVLQGRRVRPGKRDALYIHPARLGGSDLMGRKPLQFCAWLFEALGAGAGDSFEDLYPGSGIVSAAWSEFVAHRSTGDASSSQAGDASFRTLATG